MAVRFSWCVVALALVGCSSGTEGATGAEIPGAAVGDSGVLGAAHDDGGGADGANAEGDAGTGPSSDAGDGASSVTDAAADAGPAFATLTQGNQPVSFSGVHATQRGDTLEVTYDLHGVPLLGDTPLIFIYGKGDAADEPAYVGVDRRDPSCSDAAAPAHSGTATPLTGLASKRISGSVDKASIIGMGTYTATFGNLPLVAAAACL